MISLEGHLGLLNFPDQLDAVWDLVNRSKVSVTFWGSRVVTLSGFTGSVYLDDLGDRILSAGNQRSDADNLTLNERITGIEIVKTLNRFYQTTDKLIYYSNFLTRFFNWIREFSYFPYTTRFFIQDGAEQQFRGYSETKFLETFGGAFDEANAGDHPDSNGFFTPPLRVLAKEESIRALLARV